MKIKFRVLVGKRQIAAHCVHRCGGSERCPFPHHLMNTLHRLPSMFLGSLFVPTVDKRWRCGPMPTKTCFKNDLMRELSGCHYVGMQSTGAVVSNRGMLPFNYAVKSPITPMQRVLLRNFGFGFYDKNHSCHSNSTALNVAWP